MVDIVQVGLIFDKTDPERPVALDGWHIDWLQPIPNAEAFLIAVGTPCHGFLGVPDAQVYRYRFDSELQARSVLDAAGLLEDENAPA